MLAFPSIVIFLQNFINILSSNNNLYLLLQKNLNNALNDFCMILEERNLFVFWFF